MKSLTEACYSNIERKIERSVNDQLRQFVYAEALSKYRGQVVPLMSGVVYRAMVSQIEASINHLCYHRTIPKWKRK